MGKGSTGFNLQNFKSSFMYNEMMIADNEIDIETNSKYRNFEKASFLYFMLNV